METIKMACGHEVNTPDNMGRGKLRQDRLRHYAKSQCPTCTLETTKRFAAKLTRIDGTPYTAEEQAAYVARRMAGR